jgi:hypothetical protein
MAAIYLNGGKWVTAGIFLASILLREMRYLVYIRYLWVQYGAKVVWEFPNCMEGSKEISLNGEYLKVQFLHKPNS